MFYYVIIMPSEDGAEVVQYTKKELEEAIAEEVAEEYDTTKDSYLYLQNSLSELPDSNHNYWGGPLIIKGKIVQLKPKKVVKEWEVSE